MVCYGQEYPFASQAIYLDDNADGIDDYEMLIAHRFVLKALEISCHSHEMAGALASSLTDGLLCLYRKAIGQVRFPLSVERGETPITMNHYFNVNVEKQ